MNHSFYVKAIRWGLMASAFSVGCGGKELAPGGDPATTEAVDLALVSGFVGACGAAYAHPNVCCQGGPDLPSSCETYPGQPFRSCDADAGYATFPDPRTCCPLDANGGCHWVDGGTATGEAGGIDAAACAYACLPGQYASGGGCCTSDGRTQTCLGLATCDCPAAPICNCPPIPSEGVEAGASEPSCVCPAAPACPLPPPVPSCSPCPSGWQAPEREPGLCCRPQPGGVIECYSQAVPVPPPPVVHAGGPGLCASNPTVCLAGDPCVPIPCDCYASGSSDDGGPVANVPGCAPAINEFLITPAAVGISP